MGNLYSNLNRFSRSVFPGTPLNPKIAYGFVKACLRRISREILNFEYGIDNKSVNIAAHDVGLLLCGIPKVATTTFMREIAYQEALGKNVSIYSSKLADLLVNKERLESYEKVVFVRNPWARVVSCYKSKICALHPMYVKSIFIRYRGLWHNMPFDKFISWLCETDEGSDAMADRHWLSQHQFFWDEQKCLVDRIAKIENIDFEWKKICDKFGIESFLLNNYSQKTSTGSFFYRSYYKPDTKDLIARRYAKDIELLDYEF